MAVKLELSATKSAIRQLQRFDKILMQGAIFARGEIIKLWIRAKGADGKPMDDLRDKYKDKKEESGRAGVRNLIWSGKLHQGLKVFNKSFSKKIITFMTPEIKKARGNVKYAPNMLSVGKKLENATRRVVDNLFWRKVK
jgi:hypothetical protein